MISLRLLSALILSGTFSCLAATGSQTATTSLAASPAAATAGGAVTLTATVQPAISGGSGAVPKPAGGITFFDGATALNSAPAVLSATPSFTSAPFAQTFGVVDARLASANGLAELAASFTADGETDLIVYGTLPNTNGLTIQAFVNDGKGGFVTLPAQSLNFAVPVSNGANIPSAPAAIDVNGDGKMDLLDGIAVAYGNGNGTFQEPVTLPFLASGFAATYAADVNGDGRMDIVAVNTPPPASGSNQQPIQFAVTVFVNGGNGSFTSVGSFPISAPYSNPYVLDNVFGLSFVDLNGDGKLDLISQTNFIYPGNADSVNNLNVLLNNGDGTFGAPHPVSTSAPVSLNLGAYLIASGDFNGDGKTDLALGFGSNTSSGYLAVLPGNNDGTFGAAISTPLNPAVPLAPMLLDSIVASDLNFDGKLDMAVGNGILALGNGDGTFTLAAPFFPQPAEYGKSIAYPLLLTKLGSNAMPSLVYLDLQADAPAVFTPQVNSAASLAVSSLAVGTHSITAQYSGDATYAGSTSQPVTVTISPAASATTITSSANPSYAGQGVTFTASVTSGGPAPTGSVVFSSGSTTLATVALSGGSASYVTQFSSAGNQSITASYAGDGNNGSSSAAVNQAVVPAFDVQPGSGGGSLTVQSGASVTTPVSVNGMAGFTGTVMFACTGLPANASCSFNPASVNVANGASAATMLTVHTSGGNTAASALLPVTWGGGASLACGLMLILPGVRRRGQRLFVILSCCAFGIAALGAMGCGGSSAKAMANSTSTPAGSYSFNVTATAGTAQTTTAYTLTVQ